VTSSFPSIDNQDWTTNGWHQKQSATINQFYLSAGKLFYLTTGRIGAYIAIKVLSRQLFFSQRRSIFSPTCGGGDTGARLEAAPCT